ncbi:ABC-three component system middle component 7 [Cohnella sp. GCM10020058]|uniref:ABC-three component system middle component 7 n=1 Tax=Cohnella sp. GCM10020058 TaxID=3317330 RepID=UPI0036260428
MLTPNKIISFNESIIGKMIVILRHLELGEQSISKLYHQTFHNFDEIDEFIFSLEVLYLLDSIEVDFGKGAIKYVKAD